MKILVIRFSSLGDLVLLTSLLKALRKGFPASEIHLACKETYSEMFKDNGNIDCLHSLYEGGPLKLLGLHSKLRSERFGIIIDAHNVIRSNLIYHTLKASNKLQISKEQTKKTLLIKAKRNLYKRIVPQTARYREIAERLGVNTQGIFTGIDIPESATGKIEDIIHNAGYARKTLAAMAPGARWDTKRWPENHFVRLISELGKQGTETVMIGDKKEIALNGQIAFASSHPPLDVTGKLSITETAAMLKKCSVLVTNDSAPLHIAEAVGTPVVALFGPTVREFGYYPQLRRSVALDVELPCRPCSRNGARPCPLDTKECLTSITPELVLKTVRSILEKDKNGAGTTQSQGAGGI